MIAYISHPACELHETGPHHPESPARLRAIRDALLASGLDAWLAHEEAPRASREELLRVHTAAHLESLLALQPAEGLAHVDPDTPLGPHSMEAALRAAGAAVRGIDLVMGGGKDAAFCAVRPPGHHAAREHAMGFCFLNNVAVGAAHALARHGLARVAIADFDVHLGNGTEEIFAGDERVLVCSVHQHPFYPFDADREASNLVRAPIRAGADGAALREAVERDWLPALRSFAPELLLVSAGFDGHAEDPLADTAWSEADYGWITERLREVAEESCGGRLVSVLEGGYALDALGRCVVAHLRALVR